MNKNKMWDLGGAFTGVVFAVVLMIGVIIVGETSSEPTDSSAEIAREFLNRSDDTNLAA